tara:strand:+ start:603 stop:926 length:324 start_codon:yes stop_codon:yes gene_type:complete
MIFNGHTTKSISDLDQITMLQIQTMYTDGTLGNHGLLEQLAALTAGVFNYIRQPNSTAYKLSNTLGAAHDYLYPPASKEQLKEQTNSSLLAFMSQAPGFSKGLFDHG